MDNKCLCFNWEPSEKYNKWENIEIHDETLRDGLQSPSAEHPDIGSKIEILQSMSDMGIESVSIGFPASSHRIYNDCSEMLSYLSRIKDIQASCIARTLESDIQPIINLSQKYGMQLEADIFIGISSIRQYAEKWKWSDVLRYVDESIRFAQKYNLKICFLTEDTTRSTPEHIEQIYSVAILAGAQRIGICDTVGAATPESSKRIVRFLKNIIKKSNKNISIDWHGHNDRGLALANSMAAMYAGANRIHCTCMGIGERTGNIALEQLLVNLRSIGIHKYNLKILNEHCDLVSKALNFDIPVNMPIIGRDAFRTSSGIHASAITKLHRASDNRFADVVYSFMPPCEVGQQQIIDIGPNSGKANVIMWFEKHNVPYNQQLVLDVLEHAKLSNKVLSCEDVFRIINAEKTNAF